MITKQQIAAFLAPFADDAQFAADECGPLIAVDDVEGRALDIGDGPAGWCSGCGATYGHFPTCPCPGPTLVRSRDTSTGDA